MTTPMEMAENNRRFDELTRRVTRAEERLDHADARITRYEAMLDLAMVELGVDITWDPVANLPTLAKPVPTAEARGAVDPTPDSTAFPKAPTTTKKTPKAERPGVAANA